MMIINDNLGGLCYPLPNSQLSQAYRNLT